MEKRFEYMDVTHKLNDYNEIHNVNLHIENATNNEMSKLDKINETLKMRVLKIKQEYLLFENALHTYRFRCNIIYFTYVIACGLIILIGYYFEGKISNMWTFIIFSFACIIYSIIVFIFIKNNTNRRNYNYNKFYWKNMTSVL